MIRSLVNCMIERFEIGSESKLVERVELDWERAYRLGCEVGRGGRGRKRRLSGAGDTVVVLSIFFLFGRRQ